jgi:sugar phosphate isomerase/epimerase
LLTSTEKRLEGLERIKPWISNVHCNHFGQEPWPHVQALKDGASEWKPYLKALADGPADRWVLIEHVRDHSPEQFPKDAAALKEWLAELANSR